MQSKLFAATAASASSALVAKANSVLCITVPQGAFQALPWLSEASTISILISFSIRLANTRRQRHGAKVVTL